jgi:hypothetical protein
MFEKIVRWKVTVQDLILETVGDYAFSVKAHNVQGDSAYCQEQVRSLEGELLAVVSILDISDCFLLGTSLAVSLFKNLCSFYP